MKTQTIKNLRRCPKCGGEVILRKNASKRFQVACPKCRTHTGWESKIDAIISWYNLSAIYEGMYSKLGDKGHQSERDEYHAPQEDPLAIY